MPHIKEILHALGIKIQRLQLWMIFLISISFLISCNKNQDVSSKRYLYYLRDNAISKVEENGTKIDIVWNAPFTIQDVTVSADGNIIAFTKPENENRRIGFYIVSSKNIKMIDSDAEQNYGAQISPDGSYIAFQYFPGNSQWKTALYNAKKNVLKKDIFKLQNEDPFAVCGWKDRSTMVFTTFSGFYYLNVNGKIVKKIDLPDDKVVSVGIPGTKLIEIDEKLSFVLGGDIESVSDKFEGVPDNLFRIESTGMSRIFDNDVCVQDVIKRDSILYISFDDCNSDTCKQKVVKYHCVSQDTIALRCLGKLVGVVYK